jgi:hypothetical protein
MIGEKRFEDSLVRRSTLETRLEKLFPDAIRLKVGYSLFLASLYDCVRGGSLGE